MTKHLVFCQKKAYTLYMVHIFNVNRQTCISVRNGWHRHGVWHGLGKPNFDWKEVPYISEMLIQIRSNSIWISKLKSTEKDRSLIMTEWLTREGTDIFMQIFARYGSRTSLSIRIKKDLDIWITIGIEICLEIQVRCIKIISWLGSQL